MRWFCWLFLYSLAAGLITAVSDDYALAKNYTFPLAEIATQVNPDGSLWITERRTYDFSGAFSWATYTLERRGWTNIVDVNVAEGQRRYRRANSGEPGTFQVSLTPTQMEVKWHFRAEDERRTFTIRYRALGIVTRYRDTAELYWRFVGTGWEVPAAHVVIRARIPGASKDALQAWGHGPPNGTVTVREGEVWLGVDDLPAGEFVEGRILFPVHLVPGARLADTDALPRILAEEARWAREANLARLTPWLNVAMFPAAIIGVSSPGSSCIFSQGGNTGSRSTRRICVNLRPVIPPPSWARSFAGAGRQRSILRPRSWTWPDAAISRSSRRQTAGRSIGSSAR